MKKKLIQYLCLLWGIALAAQDESKHVWQGNLALPPSQQPTPLFCFGQNIGDKGDVSLVFSFDDIRGKNKRLMDVTPALLIGAADNLSLFANVPVAVSFKQNNNCSHGIEDIFIQAEYAFYNGGNQYIANQATFVGSLYLPTGSRYKNPPTGFGLPSLFGGFTLSRTAIDWYMFISSGGFLSIQDPQKNSRFFYQGGIGYNLGYTSKKWLLTLMLEFYSTLSKKIPEQFKHRCGTSGGNECWLGPSLWFATMHFVFEPGIIVNLSQLKSTLNKDYYFASISLRWKFN